MCISWTIKCLIVKKISWFGLSVSLAASEPVYRSSHIFVRCVWNCRSHQVLLGSTGCAFLWVVVARRAPCTNGRIFSRYISSTYFPRKFLLKDSRGIPFVLSSSDNCCTHMCTQASRKYEGHLESKERFAIKKYLLIIGKKKNMQVLSHTFTYFST